MWGRAGRSAVAAVLLTVATAVVPATTAAAAPGCAGTTVFEADGYRSGQTLANWRASAFNTAPPPGWRIVPVRYDAGIFPVLDDRTLDPSVADGAARMRRAVLAAHRACPASRLVLAGFSEGAIIAGDALAGLARDTVVAHRQVAGVLYGNPRRPFGDGGTGGIAGGIETNLPTILPSVTMRGPQFYGDIAVRDVCNENDGICNSANLITNFPAFVNGLAGYRGGDHDYRLDPRADLGNGLLLHRQPPRLPYGPPLPLPIGTPWQLQHQFGGPGVSGAAALAAARSRLAALFGPATDPWYRLAVTG